MTGGKKPPGSVLFVCNLNAVRSPMAEALMKKLHGERIYVDSAGIEPGETDAFAVAVMEEAGLDIARHVPTSFEDIDPASFDLIVCLTPEAHARVREATRAAAVDVEYWPTVDPFIANGSGSREQRLHAYRELRDQLRRLIGERFGARGRAAN